MQKEKTLLTIYPLGGYGEIGMNCTLLETAQGCVLLDCGLMFPEDYHLGVDVVIPRFDLIVEKADKLLGIVLTHGHEDHIGALPWLIPNLPAQIPIYGSSFTLALVEHRLREHELLDRVKLMPVKPGLRKTLGNIIFTFSRYPIPSSRASPLEWTLRPDACCTPATSNWTQPIPRAGAPTWRPIEIFVRTGSLC
jgi:Predicted hydrolase of the metallo-beta-lactamase superfamily